MKIVYIKFIATLWKGLRKGMQRTVKQSERNGVTAKINPDSIMTN